MDTARMMQLITSGFGQNLLITVLSVIFPLGLGILFSFFAGRSRGAETVFRWVSLPFECLCPVVLMCLMYFRVFPTAMSALPSIVIAFSLSFLGYMPARFCRSDSFVKNMLVNGLGLISAVFKWSFCVGYVAHLDLMKATDVIRSRTYVPDYFVIPLIASLAVLLVIEIAIRVIRQFMK